MMLLQGKEYRREVEKLIEVVKNIFTETEDLQAMLELIDNITTLGLTYHFEEEVKKALDIIASTYKSNTFPFIRKNDLYLTALCFRILRQHGYQVSQDVFCGVMDEKDLRRKSSHTGIKVMLELLEASHVALESENILHDAKAFTTRSLRNSIFSRNLENNVDDKVLPKEVVHALEIPAHWRVLWFDVKWKMDAYERGNQVHSLPLLELAKLNLNMVQATLQKDLRELSRWDARETELLPDCMKNCFQALYDTTCEIANDIETENCCKQVLPHLQKVWADFCKSLFVEATWYHKGYIPSFQEYLSNAWISSSGPLLLLHSFFSITHEVSEDTSDFLENNQDLVYNISLIIRLCNDIGTSAAEQERGDAPSSILCYMQEMNVTENSARNHIQGMIAEIWQKINLKCLTGQVPTSLSSFISITLNTARVAHSLYQSGDAFGVQVTDNRTKILSLLVEPLNINLSQNFGT